jgi:primosomal protein N' (replication factor Y)
VLTYHRTDGLLRCHYCNYHLSEVEACPKCSGTSFAYGGVGTQKVEAALARHLPQARVLRMDLDSTRKRGTLSEMIGAFERGEVDVLLGTQMVAKGFDFPRVTLVGVINADREMGLPDFRGQERAFQLLTQVAGRAGRGEKAGEAIFQTYLPDHHVITAAGLQDYDAFYRREMDERSPLGYPPFRRMANLLFDGRDEAAVIRRATAEAERLAGRKALQLLGPAPMPLSRLKGQFRWHLTLLSASAGVLAHELLGVMERAEKARPRGRVRIQVDMDPVSML